MDEIAMFGEVRDGATKRRRRAPAGKSNDIDVPAGMPLLAGIKYDRNKIAVWCPFCRVYHIHSWNHADKDCTVTHRCAHCASGSGSPFIHGGYSITVLPKVDGYLVGQIPKKSRKGR